VDLPLEDKDRVEVLKGASALYYGLTTPGGIVNLTMKRPTLNPHVAATVFGNGYGAVGGHIDAGNTWGRFGARVNAVYASVDPGIDHTRGQRPLLSAAIDFNPHDTVTLTLDAEHIFKRVNEPGVFRYNRIPPATPTNLYPALQLPPLLDPTRNFGPDWASNRAEETNVLAGVQWRITRPGHSARATAIHIWSATVIPTRSISTSTDRTPTAMGCSRSACNPAPHLKMPITA
jgi:iron complex outermembrane receptor protein